MQQVVLTGPGAFLRRDVPKPLAVQGEALFCVPAFLHRGNRRPERGDVLGSGPLCGTRGQLGLNDEAGLEEFVVRQVIEKHEKVQRLIQDGFRAIA